MIKRLVTLWCSPRISNSLLVPLFSNTAAAPRTYSSTTDKLQPRNRFELLQEFATSPVVVSNHSHCGDGGDRGDRGKTGP